MNRTAAAIARIDALDGAAHGGNNPRSIHHDIGLKRDTYELAKLGGRIEFVETPTPRDPRGTVLILNAVTSEGEIVRLPVNRTYAANLISQLAKALVS